MNCAAHSLSHGSRPISKYSASCAMAATRRIRSGSVTITSRWPWLKPALGVRWAVAAIRSSTDRSTGSEAKWRTMRRRATTSANSMAS